MPGVEVCERVFFGWLVGWLGGRRLAAADQAPHGAARAVRLLSISPPRCGTVTGRCEVPWWEGDVECLLVGLGGAASPDVSRLLEPLIKHRNPNISLSHVQYGKHSNPNNYYYTGMNALV